MKQSAQTSAAFIGARSNQSTSPNTEHTEETLLKDTNGVLFRIRNSVSFSDKIERDQMKELSQEEEQRFYKKVLKTSLI